MSYPGFDIGPLPVTYYAVIVLAALLIAGIISAWWASRLGYPAELGYQLAAWGLLGGLLGGRVAFVLLPPPSVASVLSLDWYLRHPFDLQLGPLALWSGGLDAAGALLGAGLALGLLLWRLRIAPRLWPRLLLPGLIALLLIAPWGNLVNRNLLGPALNWPGALPDALGVLRLPTPLLLSTWAGMATLVYRLARRFLPAWDAASLALAWLGLGWLWLGAYQMDVARPLLGLSLLQGFGGSILLLMLALARPTGIRLAGHALP